MSRAVPLRSLRRTTGAVAAVVLLLDAVTKQVAARALEDSGPVHVAGGVHFTLYRNFGGPTGFLSEHTVLVSITTLVVVIALGIAAMFMVHSRPRAIAFGLFLGGGLGNLADRLTRAPGPFRGGVVDWLQLRPGSGSMNLADLSLNLAVVVLVGGVLVQGWRERKQASLAPE